MHDAYPSVPSEFFTGLDRVRGIDSPSCASPRWHTQPHRFEVRVG